jgi:ParB family chromosome partitioning protein
MKRKALGKGLSALLPEADPQRAAGDAQREVPIDQIEPNPQQPRSHIDAATLSELAESIRQNGVVQPILVRPRGDRFQIVAGERRWRASSEAGLTRVPVNIREVPDDKLLELALIENIQREELTPLEEARAYQRLQEELGLTQEDVARRVGRDRATVANTVRLLRAPAPVRQLLERGSLGAGHVRALLALDDARDQQALANEAARQGLSVREVEKRVARLRAPATRAAKPRDPNTRAAEERLRAALGTRVEIARRARGGSLKIAFTSEAELNRLFELLIRTGGGR